MIQGATLFIKIMTKPVDHKNLDLLKLLIRASITITESQ